MAYTRCEYDVFISYTHADDVPDAAGKGWVEQLYEGLKKLLPQRLRGETPAIFFDRSSVESNHQLSRLRTAARNSAVFLAVVSPNYAARPWTKAELSAFTENNNWKEEEATRLFVVECLEPEERSLYPPPLDSAISTKFWESHGSVAMPLRSSQEDYSIKLAGLASAIAKKLRQMQEAAAREEALRRSASGIAADSAAPCVLLAQTTDDLDEERERVRSYLAQFDIPVVPTESYPQGGEEFRAAFAADLARAKVFVQLLSASAGRRPPDLPDGYTQFQATAAARAKGLEIMQWRSPELKLDAVANAEHRRLLSGENVVTDTIESFKAAVVRKAAKPPTPPGPSIPPASGFVFIDASQDDIETARQIDEELHRESLNPALPLGRGSPEEIRADLEENLVECSALVLVYGQTTPLWVRAQLRLYSKLKSKRSSLPRVLELWLEPPENKDDPGMRLSEARRIRLRAPLDKQALRPLIEALSA